VNTLGSVIGCIITIFLLLGFAGMKGTIYTAASVDLIIGLIALTISKPFAQGQKT
jgi:glycopeptide antibiotics resistance protein